MLAAMIFALAVPVRGAEALSPIERLGRAIFFDTNLSRPAGQSCAACHAPEVGWTGPDSAINAAGAVMPGAISTRFGNRKPPSSAYAGESPILHVGCGCLMPNCGCSCACGDGMSDTCPPALVGGMFWDGRATGWMIGDPLAEQAMAPFLNPLEQNNPNERFVCLSVSNASYADLFREVWGPDSLDPATRDVGPIYELIALSIAAYERSPEVNPFSSRFDTFWRNAVANGLDVCAITPGNMGGGMGGGGMGGGGMGGGGMGGNMEAYRGLGLSDMELMGLALFNTKGNCSVCHWLTPGPGNSPPLFTDFRYHNLGVPRNPENPFYDMPRVFNPDGDEWVDLGLGGFLATIPDGIGAPGSSELVIENLGKHKTPTLRNVDKRPYAEFVKAYGHNGYFKSLMSIVHFYNTRDILPVCTDGGGIPGVDCWPPPEVPLNVNTDLLGNLGLTEPQGMAIIMFMKALTDA